MRVIALPSGVEARVIDVRTTTSRRHIVGRTLTITTVLSGASRGCLP